MRPKLVALTIDVNYFIVTTITSEKGLSAEKRLSWNVLRTIRIDEGLIKQN